jgi:SHO1 osmosensor
LFLILGVLYTLASDSIAMHRFQISIFGAVAIVFAVMGVDQGIFSGVASLDAMAAGWLILAVIDILWVLYFTSEEDSLTLHIFNSMGTGGLTPPRRRRTRTQSAGNNLTSGNGYANNYAAGSGIGNDPYEPKMGSGGAFGGGAGIRSQNSFNAGSQEGPLNRSMGGGTGAGSIHDSPAGGGAVSIGGIDTNTPNSPLMAGIGAGIPGGVSSDPSQPSETYSYKAKALYSCELYLFFQDKPKTLI